MSFIVSSDCVACDVEGGIAVLNLRTNLYFGLDPVGAEVWKHLHKPVSVSDLADLISSDFDILKGECEGDISRLLNQMSDHGLIVSA